MADMNNQIKKRLNIYVSIVDVAKDKEVAVNDGRANLTQGVHGPVLLPIYKEMYDPLVPPVIPLTGVGANKNALIDYVTDTLGDIANAKQVLVRLNSVNGSKNDARWEDMYVTFDAGLGPEKMFKNYRAFNTPGTILDPASKIEATVDNFLVPHTLPIEYIKLLGFERLHSPDSVRLLPTGPPNYDFTIPLINPPFNPPLTNLNQRFTKVGNTFNVAVGTLPLAFSGNSQINAEIRDLLANGANPVGRAGILEIRNKIKMLIHGKEMGDSLQVIWLKYILDIIAGKQEPPPGMVPPAGQVMNYSNTCLMSNDLIVHLRGLINGVPILCTQGPNPILYFGSFADQPQKEANNFSLKEKLLKNTKEHNNLVISVLSKINQSLSTLLYKGEVLIPIARKLFRQVLITIINNLKRFNDTDINAYIIAQINILVNDVGGITDENLDIIRERIASLEFSQLFKLGKNNNIIPIGSFNSFLPYFNGNKFSLNPLIFDSIRAVQSLASKTTKAKLNERISTILEDFNNPEYEAPQLGGRVGVDDKIIEPRISSMNKIIESPISSMNKIIESPISSMNKIIESPISSKKLSNNFLSRKINKTPSTQINSNQTTTSQVSVTNKYSIEIIGTTEREKVETIFNNHIDLIYLGIAYLSVNYDKDKSLNLDCLSLLDYKTPGNWEKVNFKKYLELINTVLEYTEEIIDSDYNNDIDFISNESREFIDNIERKNQVGGVFKGAQQISALNKIIRTISRYQKFYENTRYASITNNMDEIENPIRVEWDKGRQRVAMFGDNIIGPELKAIMEGRMSRIRYPPLGQPSFFKYKGGKRTTRKIRTTRKQKRNTRKL